ncbi:protein of unknown function [Nitratireductor aquimarinus]
MGTRDCGLFARTSILSSYYRCDFPDGPKWTRYWGMPFQSPGPQMPEWQGASPIFSRVSRESFMNNTNCEGVCVCNSSEQRKSAAFARRAQTLQPR